MFSSLPLPLQPLRDCPLSSELISLWKRRERATETILVNPAAAARQTGVLPWESSTSMLHPHFTKKMKASSLPPTAAMCRAFLPIRSVLRGSKSFLMRYSMRFTSPIKAAQCMALWPSRSSKHRRSYVRRGPNLMLTRYRTAMNRCH